MIPIIIDTTTLPFGIASNKDLVERVVDSVIKDITASLAREWEQQAIHGLHQTRERYINNLFVIDEGRMAGSVVLDYSKDPMIRMIEEGASAYDLKCIVNPHTRIYTSKGWIKIKNIIKGDLVLTHKGKFKRVSNIFKEKNNDDFIYKIKVKFNNGFNLRSEVSEYLVITNNHPILTNKGWVRADKLTENHKLCVPSIKCSYCNKLVPTLILNNERSKIYCNKSCVDEINRVLMNHNDEYCFTYVDFEIEKIKKQKLATIYNYKYNITVEDDSSYIANGIVTHNSGFAKSSKKKMKADGGWYLTVPFRQATPGAVAESSVFSSKMPQDIYDIVKNKETNIDILGGGQRSAGLKIEEIPEKYQIKETRASDNIPESKAFKEYQHKSSLYEGITKIKDSKTGQNMYMSFRRVSDKSDPNSWIHPGMDMQNFGEKALSKIEQNMDVELNRAMNKILAAIGF